MNPGTSPSPRRIHRPHPSRRGRARKSLALLTACLAPFLASACSRSSVPPGGEKAAAAASEAGESYAKGLNRGIQRASRDRLLGDFLAAQRALEQRAADESAFPIAGSCADLARAAGVSIPEVDPWGTAVECRSGADGYLLRSAGEDGVSGSADDVLVEGGTPPPS